MRQRPLTVASCALMCLIILVRLLGIPDLITRTRQELRSREPYLSDWDDISFTGQISRIFVKEDKTTLHIDNLSNLRKSDHQSTGDDNDTRLTSPAFRDFSVQVSIKSNDRLLEEGSYIKIKGKMVFPSEPTCPGQFHTLFYYDSKGILFQVVNAEIISYGENHTALTYLQRLKRWLLASYERVLGAEDAGALSSITLGDKTKLDSEFKRLLQDGGVSHVLAISGLHVGLLAMSLYRILRKHGAPFGICALLSTVLLLLYCYMTGMSSSTVRASVMFILWSLSQFTGRSSDGLSALGLSACILLIGRPAYIMDGGFQLSFGCMLSIFFVSPALDKLMNVDDGKDILHALKRSLSASLAITIGTLPITCWHFYQFCPYSPLLNLFVLPSLSLLVISGLAGALSGSVFYFAGVFAAAPCHYLLKAYEVLCRGVTMLPGAIIVTGRPPIWAIILYYFILLLLIHLKDKRFFHRWIVFGGLCFNAALLCLQNAPSLRMIFLDVGQGDGIVIQTGRDAILVDGGSSSESDLWQYKIEPCLKYYGIRRVTSWFATHGDLDHISALEELSQCYSKNLLGGGRGGITIEAAAFSEARNSSEALLTLADQLSDAGIPVVTAKAFSTVRREEVSISILYPEEKDSSLGENEASLTLLVESRGGFRALLTGDLEKDGEKVFLARFKDLEPVDLLKIGHHGSKYATSEELLLTLSPRMGIISCGENNRYHHPSAEVLERLRKAGVTVYRTDTMGSILVEEGSLRWPWSSLRRTAIRVSMFREKVSSKD